MKAIILPLLVISVLFLVTNHGNAYASLVGDSVEIEVSSSGLIQGPQSPVTVIEENDNSTETSFVLCGGFSGGTNIDIDESSIWLVYDSSSPCIQDQHTIWFTSLNWVNNPSGFIEDVIVGPNSTLVPADLQFGPNEIHITLDEFITDGNQESLHLEIVPNHQIAGELLPLDSTALLLAGLNSVAIWMIPVITAIGAGLYLGSNPYNRRNLKVLFGYYLDRLRKTD